MKFSMFIPAPNQKDFTEKFLEIITGFDTDKGPKNIFFITTYGMFLNKPYRKGFQTFLLSVLAQCEVNL